MDVTTILYLQGPEGILMLHRNKKAGDINAGKWIGIGGHVEEGESPAQCVIREAYEETGLLVKEPRIRALVTFVSRTEKEGVETLYSEQMFVFTADAFEGELRPDCPEGDLAWVPAELLFSLPMWEGDPLFLGPVLGDAPFFALRLEYNNDELVRWSVE